MTLQTTARLHATTVLVVCLLALPASRLAAQTPVAQTPSAQISNDRLVESIETLRGEYERQRLTLEADHAAFTAYLGEVDALKGEREGASAIASDDELRDALRQAREMALNLQRQSQQLRETADEMSALETQLLMALDGQLSDLEGSLRQATPESRRQILSEIMDLSQLRERYLRPLEPVPEVQLDAIVLGLEEETTPEELRATADELSDNERRLSEHLGEIEARIQTLESELELRERDRLFRREAGLFEEGVSSGAAATARRGSAGASDQESHDATTGSAGAGSDRGDGDAVAVGDEPSSPPPTGTEGQGTAEPGSTGGMGGEPTATPSENDAFDGGGTVDGTAGDGPLDDGNARSPDSDGFVGEPAGDLPEPSLTGVARPDEDPTILWPTTDRLEDEGLGVRGRIDRLRQEREELRNQLEELRDRRNQLLERVEDLEELEGF